VEKAVMKNRTHSDLKHFLWPYKVGNIIILVLGGAIFIPLFIGWLGLAISMGINSLTGAR
jgi:hypothetical protein